MAVNLKEEKFLWKQGYKLVVGFDEAGRGPLAGPVVAAAVMCNFTNKKHSWISNSQKIFYFGLHTNIRKFEDYLIK